MSVRSTLPISTRLISKLNEVATAFERQGVRLFIFGSIARTFPSSYRGSDLDLGYELPTGSDTATLRRELEQAVESLPTIRRVDLVDFSKAEGRFQRVAGTKTIELPTHHD